MSNKNNKNIEEVNQKLIDELIWVRSMVRVFTKLENKIKNTLGDNGLKKIVLKENYFSTIITFNLAIIGLGLYMFTKTYDYSYFITLFIPILSYLFFYNQIKKARDTNLLRFVSKIPAPDDNILYTVEEYVFLEREYFEDITAWYINKYTKIPKENFSHLFDPKYWSNYEKAQLQCGILAVLMVSLQQYLYLHRRTYLEYVKKLPIMNEIQQDGYRIVQSRLKKKVQKEVPAEDIQTFGGFLGFTKED